MAGNIVPIDMFCVNCGHQLAVAGERQGVGAGLRSLIFVHAEDGKEDCFQRKVATPHDAFAAARAYEEARP